MKNVTPSCLILILGYSNKLSLQKKFKQCRVDFFSLENYFKNENTQKIEIWSTRVRERDSSIEHMNDFDL